MLSTSILKSTKVYTQKQNHDTMKIAINCIFYRLKGGGIAEYICNLVNNLEKVDTENEYLLYVLSDYVDFARQHLPQRFKIKEVPYSGEGLFNVVKRSIFIQRFWAAEETLEKFDIFHSPFFHSPVFKKAKIVITVHDLRFFRFPATYTIPRYLFLRTAVKKSVKRADHIIAISNFTKNELIDAYALPDNKISVVLEAISSQRFNEQQISDYVLPDQWKILENGNFILTVGHIEPRKNYERLIDAFKQIKTNGNHHNLKLVIVGQKMHHYKHVLQQISEEHDILWLNFVEHKFLLWLFKNAKLFVFPSLYEGFGFPPLEAGCFGTVSAVSNVSSIPEVCGNAVQYFDPYQINDIANSIDLLLSDQKRCDELRKLMYHRISELSWERNAQQTMEIYNRLEKEHTI